MKKDHRPCHIEMVDGNIPVVVFDDEPWYLLTDKTYRRLLAAILIVTVASVAWMILHATP